MAEVWIDQDLCTGDGLCEEIAPAVFHLLDDGLAYVKSANPEENRLQDDGSWPHKTDLGKVAIREDLDEAVREARDECPGECIFIED